MALLRAPRKGAVACSLPLSPLHSLLPLQMLKENIQVASLITDSLQQKVYSMALEELEAFLGRSVEPLAALPCPRSAWVPWPGAVGCWGSAVGNPVLVQVPEGSAACLPRGHCLSPRGQQLPGLAALSASAGAPSPALLGGARVPTVPPCPTARHLAAGRGKSWEGGGCPRAPKIIPAPDPCGEGCGAVPVAADSLCCRLREALVRCGKERQKDRAVPKYYISYLLATLNNNLALG